MGPILSSFVLANFIAGVSYDQAVAYYTRFINQAANLDPIEKQ